MRGLGGARRDDRALVNLTLSTDPSRSGRSPFGHPFQALTSENSPQRSTVTSYTGAQFSPTPSKGWI